MAMWQSCTVTRAGAQLLMKMQALEIYAAKYGTETAPEEELKFQTDISEPGGMMSIVDIKSYDWGFEIVIRTDNSKLTEETVIKQVGFFARFKGSNEPGVLFAVAQDETGDRVPTPEDMPNFNLEFTIAVAADTSAEISIVIDPTTTATVGYVEKYVAAIRHEIEIHIDNVISEFRLEIEKKPDVHVFASRIRDNNKTDYGFAGSGEFKIRLDTSEYTGNAEISVVRENNTLLDADNMTQNAASATNVVLSRPVDVRLSVSTTSSLVVSEGDVTVKAISSNNVTTTLVKGRISSSTKTVSSTVKMNAGTYSFIVSGFDTGTFNMTLKYLISFGNDEMVLV